MKENNAKSGFRRTVIDESYSQNFRSSPIIQSVLELDIQLLINFKCSKINSKRY